MGTRTLTLLSLVFFLLSGCLSKPAPWRPDGTGTRGGQETTSDATHRGETRLADGVADIHEALPDADSLAPDHAGVETTDADIPGDLPAEIDLTHVDVPSDEAEDVSDAGADEFAPDVTELEAECKPDCDGKDCGEDGCGGFCGELSGACDDGNPCSDNACMDGVCSFTNNEADCDDDILCTFDDKCDDGVCAGQPYDCSDGNDCTTDTCDGEDGCDYAPFWGPCDDADPCTTDDTCVNQVCTGIGVVTCDDENLCTDDSCVPMQGCQFINNEAPCEDGNVCTGEDQCFEGSCQPGPAVSETCDQPDLDHDGVCPYEGCGVIAGDECPTVWNPDNDPAMCPPAPAGFAASRPIVLSEMDAEEGRSTWRRTYEPVEIPLVSALPLDSLIGYWPLTAGQASDDSGGGHHGQVSGTTSYAGKVGQPAAGLLFNGQNSYVALADKNGANDGDFLAELSISVWAVVVAPTGSSQTLWHDDSGTSRTQLSWLPDGSVTFSQQAISGGGNLTCGSVELGKWFHVAGTWDGEQAACYLNGALGETTPAEGMTKGSSGTRLGLSLSSSAPLWGALDEVFILDRALDADEVRAHAALAAPLGKRTTPGAQHDYDDLRVTEESYPSLGEYQVPMEIVGVRPHSDTLCPSELAEVPVNEIPHAADREDLCGVLAYWPLDGEAQDVMGVYDGANNGAIPTLGRFGDSQGALKFDGQEAHVDTGLALQLGSEDSFTIEAWIRCPEEPQSSFSLFGFGAQEQGELWIQVKWTGDTEEVEHRLADDSSNTSGATVQNTRICDHGWHHVAYVRDVSRDQVCLFLNGLAASCIEDTTGEDINAAALSLFVGAQNHADGPMHFAGDMDEVLVHEFAKSAEYLFRRAHPSVPTARFLVSTQPDEYKKGGFNWYDYKMIWGNAEANADAPLVRSLGGEQCHGLLSSCMGYGGWWRVDRGVGLVAVDSSTNKNNGALLPAQSPPQWGAGMDGAGLMLDGQGSHVRIPASSTIEPADAFTIEAAVSVEDHDTAAHTIAARPICHEESDQDSLFLSVAAEDEGASDWPPSALVARTSTSNGAGQTVTSTENQIFEDGEWALVGAVYDGTGITLNVGDESWQAAASGAVVYDAHDLFFGTSPGGCSDAMELPMKGHLDSVRIMNRALSPDEMLHHPRGHWTMGMQEGCVPDCFGRECGPDGCGGDCGICTEPNQTCSTYGICGCEEGGIWCVDSCCKAGDVCYQGLCCEPQCGNCGDDECGGSCGTCDDGLPCTEDVCKSDWYCSYQLKDGYCKWWDACYSAGEQSNPCLYCDPSDPYDYSSTQLNGKECAANAWCCNGGCHQGVCD